jgi:predicted transcriptional regulator
MDASRPPLSEAELMLMKVLWEHGPGTVRQLSVVLKEPGSRWAYTTVLTLLQRLATKGYVAVDSSASAHVFRADVSREQVIRQELQNVADQLCEGAPAPLLLALVEGHRFSLKEIARFRQMLDDLEEKKRGGGRPSSRK